MKPLAEVESWDVVSRKAYWDRDVALEKWREKVAEGHRSYLPDAVSAMDVRAGQIRSKDVVEGGHRKRKLYPAYGAAVPSR
jgi:hypothetical protein